MDEEGTFDLAPVRPLQDQPSITTRVYQTLRQAIISGRIGPNERLRQIPLAEQLGVNQRTVREALGTLIAEGLAVAEPNKGVRVVRLPIEEVMDLYRMRVLLEPLAMESAAGHLSSQDLARMRELLQLSADDALGSTTSVSTANNEFHSIAIRASGRQQLIRVLGLVWQLIALHARLTERLNAPESDLQRARTLREHQAMLDALTVGDGKRAARVAQEHAAATLASLERSHGGNSGS